MSFPRCMNCKTALNDEYERCPNCGRIKVTSSFSVPMESLVGVSKTLSIPMEADAISSLLDHVNIVTKLIVIPGEKTNEGQIIKAVCSPFFELIERLKQDPDFLNKVQSSKRGRILEEIMAGYWKQFGYEVILTPQKGDKGRDVIAINEFKIYGLGSIRIIDQIKAYAPDHQVTAEEVLAIVGVLTGDHASKAFFTTTSYFAPGVENHPYIKPLIPSRLELIDRDRLIKNLIEIKK